MMIESQAPASGLSMRAAPSRISTRLSMRISTAAKVAPDSTPNVSPSSRSSNFGLDASHNAPSWLRTTAPMGTTRPTTRSVVQSMVKLSPLTRNDRVPSSRVSLQRTVKAAESTAANATAPSTTGTG